jgi:hypothetical protein
MWKPCYQAALEYQIALGKDSPDIVEAARLIGLARGDKARGRAITVVDYGNVKHHLEISLNSGKSRIVLARFHDGLCAMPLCKGGAWSRLKRRYLPTPLTDAALHAAIEATLLQPDVDTDVTLDMAPTRSEHPQDPKNAPFPEDDDI